MFVHALLLHAFYTKNNNDCLPFITQEDEPQVTSIFLN